MNAGLQEATNQCNCATLETA